jgi:hypothetical protein
MDSHAVADALHTPQERIKHSINYWYSILCSIWWILEVTMQNSTKAVIPFRDCWKAGRSSLYPSEDVGFSSDDWVDFCHVVSPVVVEKLPKVQNTPREVTPQKMEKYCLSAKYTKVPNQHKHQKKLSVYQLEELSHYLDEQLSHSKKKSFRLDHAPGREVLHPVDPLMSAEDFQKSPISIIKIKDQYEKVQFEQQQIAHEQLSSFKEKHVSRNERKLINLHCSGSIWADLHTLRKISPVESCVEAKKKMIGNCKWLVLLICVYAQYAALQKKVNSDVIIENGGDNEHNE